MEESLPPGFRFHPTDEELISYYLTGKVSDVGFTSKAIAVVDLNKCEPWDLPGKASMGEKEWYFFSLRDRKYPTGLRTNRATEAGYWKTTGKDKEIFRAGSVQQQLVGMKKTLVFYKGRAPRGEKSNWVMHEYRLESKHPFRSTKEEWVVCRVFQKSAIKKPVQQTPISSQLQPSDLDQSPCETNSNHVNEFGDIELPNLNSNFANSSSSRFISNISPQSSYHSDNNNTANNMIRNMNSNMNWAAIREAAAAAATLPSLPWRPGSSLLTSAAGLSVNSLLLKALQQRSYPQREEAASTNDHFSYNIMPQGIISHLGSNDLSSNLQASSSKVLESAQVPQQSEQPFNLDSIW